MKNLRLTFGIFVQRQRRVRGLTQAQLAEQVGMSVDAVSMIERGKIGATFDTIGALAGALKVHPAVLFGGRAITAGKPTEALDQIVEKLAQATPAQLKRINTVVDAMLE